MKKYTLYLMFLPLIGFGQVGQVGPEETVKLFMDAYQYKDVSRLEMLLTELANIQIYEHIRGNGTTNIAGDKLGFIKAVINENRGDYDENGTVLLAVINDIQATLCMKYVRIYLNGAKFCGNRTFSLVNLGKRWQVNQMVETRVLGCPNDFEQKILLPLNKVPKNQ